MTDFPMNDALWVYTRLVHNYHADLVRAEQSLADAKRKAAELAEAIPKLEHDLEVKRRWTREAVGNLVREGVKLELDEIGPARINRRA